MALSDYERRILDEIEAELRLRPARSRRMRRAVVLIAASVIVAGALMTLAALALPAGLDVAVAGVVGVALGYLVAMTWRRHRRGDNRRRDPGNPRRDDGAAGTGGGPAPAA